MMDPRVEARGLAYWMALGAILSVAVEATAAPMYDNCYRCATGGRVCIPNVGNFGHFQRQWRRWPGEPRPDQEFPQALGREILPTPEGNFVVPGESLPQQQPQPPESLQQPFGQDPALPDFEPLPEDASPPQQSEEMPDQPAGPKQIEPGLEGGLPGIPMNAPGSGGAGGLPGLPADSSPAAPAGPAVPAEPKGGLPGLPDQSPAATEPTPSGAASPSTPPPNQGSSLPYGELPFYVAPEGGSVPEVSRQRAPLADSQRSEPSARYATAPVADSPTGPAPTYRTDGTTSDSMPGYDLAGGGGTTATAAGAQSTYPQAMQPEYRHAPVGNYAATVPEFRPRQPSSYVASDAGYADRYESPMAQEYNEPAGAGASPDPVVPAQHVAELPLGLDGFCPVELTENENWTRGDAAWAVSHAGRTYLLSGPSQQQRFLADPSRYSPVFAGHDPVLAVDENRTVSGSTEHCVVYGGRLYMFSSAESKARFQQDAQRYVAFGQGQY